MASTGSLAVSGLATGMDTQGTIKKIMQYQKAPIEGLKQQETLLEWKQAAFRTQNTAMSALQQQVFDLKLQTTYNVRKVNSTNPQAATATAAANAPNGNYTIQVTQLATSASNVSSKKLSIRSSIVGNYLNPTATTPIVIDSVAENNKITISLDSGTTGAKSQTLALPDKTYDGSTNKTLGDLAKDIQTQIDDNSSAIKGQVMVKATADHELQFYTIQKDDGTAHTLTLQNDVGADYHTDATLANLGFNNQANDKELIGSILTPPSSAVPIVIGSSKYNQFKITLGDGAMQTVTLSAQSYDGTTGKTLNDFAADIQTQIRALSTVDPKYANVNVSVGNYNQIRFSATDGSGNPLAMTLNMGTSDALSKMGMSDGLVSDKAIPLVTSSSIWTQKDRFANTSFFKNANGSDKAESSTFSFSINGQAFNFNMDNTLDEIIKTVNSKSQAGVAMAYDSYNDKLSLTASKSGLNPGGSNIQITDTDGFLNQVLNVTQTGEIKGKNAILNINGVDTQKTENTFTQSGVSFTLAGAGSSTITVSTDASTVKNQIQKFVDNYNTLLANMNTKLTEEKATTGDKYTNYKPLSDDQKSAMSQTQIDAWNVQAQLGILQNDDTLQQAVTDMRMSLGRVVQTPLTITGTALSGTVDLTGGSHFSMTVGSQTREIYLDANSYSSTDYGSLVSDVQNKLDMAFGTGDVKVALDDKNQLTYTSQNIAMTVNNGAQNNGLESLGFTNGATVSHTYDRLSDIGITPSDNYLDNGKLTFDSDAFAAAIANDPNGVMRLLTNDQPASFTPTDTPILIAQKQDQENASKGIFYSFNEKLMGIPMISNEGTVNGIKGGLIHLFTNKAGLTGTGASDNELGKQILELNTQISDAQRRYNDQVDHLNSVFTHMETVIQKYNTQSAWLTAQLGGAPAASSGGNGGNQ